MATAGPMPMMAGGTPTAAKERKMAMMGRPRRSASRRVISITAAAPSVTWAAGGGREGVGGGVGGGGAWGRAVNVGWGGGEREGGRQGGADASAPTWLLLPAVVVPLFLNAGLSWPSEAGVVPGRMPSSASITTRRSSPGGGWGGGGEGGAREWVNMQGRLVRAARSHSQARTTCARLHPHPPTHAHT